MQKSRNKIALLLLLSCLCFLSYSQNSKSDALLLQENTFEKDQYLPQKVSFLWVTSNNIILKYNPLSLGFGALMYVYQRSISRHFSASCLYSPSCSRFSRDLIKNYGLLEGIFLTADRIMRCNRIAAMDIPFSDYNDSDHKVHETTDLYQ